MNEPGLDDPRNAGTVEVLVYQDGRLLHRQLCESDEQASDVVAQWSELPGVTCDVEDLAARHEAGDILEAEPAEPFDEDR
ncbi:hypothetical protein [Amycolatopsis alkalitolerans]|uniref:Uncharacterized protein n=1 Tax=Amycolatopsis alkalitolerans TaxID=2547244 RepID=A0A5C4LT24_9PSEU|nr:hypothetical protein [Amycolatopsis alkalitolerans]TNC21829.1 hypothetical protein FG385_27310 [Amycolatopsis alkalitolerans]